MTGRSAVVDTNVFITARTPSERGFEDCRKLIDQIDRGGLKAILSAITIAELRAGIPPNRTETGWRPMLTHFLTSPNYQIEPVDSDIAESAGELRASDGLTLPDAIIIATARICGASVVISQDEKLARQQQLVRVIAPDRVK